jgi:hypothetical protein
MNEIEELEKRWIKYKLKRSLTAIFYLSAIVIVALSIPSGYEMFREYQARKAEEAKKKEQNRTVVATNSEPVARKDTPQPEEMASIKPEKRKHVRAKVNIIVSDEPIDADNPNITTNGIDFGNGVDNKTLVKTIESRFKVTKDYDDAMFLAKYYYGKRSYRKSEHWAMRANSIDSSQEESWIIFAKSKAKQGRRADSLRVLQAYFDRTGSMRVKKLIDRIRKGKKF